MNFKHQRNESRHADKLPSGFIEAQADSMKFNRLPKKTKAPVGSLQKVQSENCGAKPSPNAKRLRPYSFVITSKSMVYMITNNQPIIILGPGPGPVGERVVLCRQK